MINYIKKKLEKRRVKRNFKEYGNHIVTYNLEKDGKVDFALWDNPLEGDKTITQQDVDYYRYFVKNGDFIIDIGSHTGDTTVPMALAAGKEGLVLGFDPNPYVFGVLTVNAGLNKDKTNIVPLNLAITEKEGEFFYSSSEATHNNGGISKQADGKHGKYQLSQKIKGINLLKYLKANYAEQLPKLSFIKIDTEGHDKDLILSFLDLLKEFRPSMVVECFKKSNTEYRNELFNLFKNLNYNLYKINEDNDNYSFEELTTKEDMMKFSHFDFFAIAEEKPWDHK